MLTVSERENGIMETQLIIAAKAGDSQAFSELVRRYSRRVYRLAYSFMHNVDDAADIVQEVFLRTYRNFSRFDTTRPLYPWLHRITRNLCINRRNLKVSGETSLPLEELLPATGEDPLALTLAHEAVTELEAAIGKLPDAHREIIMLKHYEECTYAEMAEILDIPIGTVMSRLYHARRKLKTLLTDSGAAHDV